MPLEVDQIKLYHPLNTTEGDSDYGGDIDLDNEMSKIGYLNLFDNVTDQERIDGDIEYRKFFVYNHNDGDGSTWRNVKCWIAQQTLSEDDSIAICLGTNTDTRSEAVNYTYYQPDNLNHPNVLDIGDMPTDSKISIWVKRTVSQNSNKYYSNEFRLLLRSTAS